MLQADTEHVTREVEQLRRRQGHAEELDTSLGELVSLVEQRNVDAW
jgi:hypothetical protein